MYLFAEIQEIVTSSQETVNEPYTSSSAASLKKGEFNLYDFGTNLSGFIGARVQCTEPTRIMFYFDELLTDGDVKTKQRHSDICIHIVYELQPGAYDIETWSRTPSGTLSSWCWMERRR